MSYVNRRNQTRIARRLPRVACVYLVCLGGMAVAADPQPPATAPALIPAPVPIPAPATATAPTPVPLPVLVPNSAGRANKVVTNLWVDTDVRQVIQDISSQTDTVIVCDQTVQGAVSMSVKEMPVADCLERVCAIGGYSYTLVKDYYIVGRAEPGTPLFQRIAEPERVQLGHILPEQVRTLLQPTMLPYVTFDKVSGTVVVTAPQPLRGRILEAIKQVDQANPQVAIEAIVFELSESGSKQLALDWEFTTPHVAMTSQNLINTFTYGVGSDIGTYVNLSLRAIVESGKGQVLANPKVLVMNNTDAEIFVGQEKYFTLLSGQASNPYYTLQAIKAGITLKAEPSIGKDGQILLKLEPEVSDVVDELGADNMVQATHGPNTSSPVVTRRHARTVVDIKDGQTLLIGGLIRDQHRKLIDKVPFVGDIPGAGAAFRHIRQENVRQEIVILLTVHIVTPAQAATDKVTSRLVQRYVTPLDAVMTHAQGK